MRHDGKLLLCLAAALCALGTGCRNYEVWQADRWRSPDFHPEQIKRAAVVIPGHDLDRNKTFAEAMIVAVHHRGARLVEQQLVDAVTRESRLILRKEADLVSTRDLASRIGKELNVDTIIYADATSRRTFFELNPKLFGANESEAMQRQQEANRRGSLVPEDVRRCKVFIHHMVGLSVRVVDVATGRIQWVGFRQLAMGDKYEEDRPDLISTFGAVRMLSQRLTEDMYGTPETVVSAK